MSYNFVPHGSYIAAKLIEQETKTSGGIILPDQAKQRPHLAKIIAVGPGLRSLMTDQMLEIPLKPGDLVFINKFGVQELEFPGGGKVALFQYGDVYGILEKAEDEEE